MEFMNQITFPQMVPVTKVGTDSVCQNELCESETQIFFCRSCEGLFCLEHREHTCAGKPGGPDTEGFQIPLAPAEIFCAACGSQIEGNDNNARLITVQLTKGPFSFRRCGRCELQIQSIRAHAKIYKAKK